MLILVLLLLLVAPVGAQSVSAPCGVVDAIDYPIDGLVKGYDDFALYRARFGGNHTGIDIGFDRWGDPVRAAARGRVTYADIEGWDTEKGVVIVEHTFPDGSIAYSLYGHMEQTDTIRFPTVGRCVERGDVLGAIGWPSRGRPHLHYEIRDFLPNDGGPGYVTGNPLAEGWYNPLDFTALWRARLTPAFVSFATFELIPALPPVRLDSGLVVIAAGDLLEGVLPPRQTLWRVQTDGMVIGLAALPGDRVVAHTRTGQVIVLQGGRYAALWTVKSADAPFLALGETLVFLMPDGGLAAYDAAGALLWSLPGTEDRVTQFAGHGDQVAVSSRAGDGGRWRLVAADGQTIADERLETPPLAAPSGSGWLLLAGGQLWQYADGRLSALAPTGRPAGRSAALAGDFLGGGYLYLGDAESTLLAVGAEGQLRWRSAYPGAPGLLPPLLATGGGCLLYGLDADGMLNVFDAATGDLAAQLQLYAGGAERASPGARLLQADAADRLTVAAGFLTVLTLDGRRLAPAVMDACRLG